MAVDDEILPATIDNVTVYRNVARAVHTGIEASSRLRAFAWLALDASYAYARFTLDEFGVFSGNRLPGVPPQTGSVRATLTGGAWDAYGAVTFAGSAFVSDANTERADAYGVVTAGVSRRLGRLRVFARVDNVADVRYTNRIQVNDGSGNYYYPAPGRNASAGLEVQW
jgi:iron complex outermembrane receptor protein